MGIDDGAGKADPADEAVVSPATAAMPQALRSLLGLDAGGIASDFVNKFAGPLGHYNNFAEGVLTEEELVAELIYVVGKMPLYSEYLIDRINKYNAHLTDDSQKSDANVVTEKLMIVPKAAVIDAKVLAIKQFVAENNDRLKDQLGILKIMLEEGLELVRNPQDFAAMRAEIVGRLGKGKKLLDGKD